LGIQDFYSLARNENRLFVIPKRPWIEPSRRINRALMWPY
jgi:hypothetical protein